MKLAGALKHIPRLAFRLRGAHRTDTFPLRLTRGRIYVLPTGAGLAFAIALLVMLLAAINYGLSLGYALVFLLFGIAAASLFQTYRNLADLRVVSMQVEPVFAGESATLHVGIDHLSSRHRAGLRLRNATGEAIFELSPASQTTVAIALPTTRRGWHPVGRLTLITTWPLGLTRAWSLLRPDLACLAYPTPEASPPPMPGGGEEIDGKRTPRPGDDDFAGLRGHRLTDSPRHVAWKILAGGGPLLTKEFTTHEGASLHFDWQQLPDQLDDDARAARLSAWVLSAEASGQRYALTTPEGSLPADRGQHHLRACLTRLATARSSNEAH